MSYLQPAELRPQLVEVLAYLGVAMRWFGGTEDFLALIERIRTLAPQAGIRSNVIVGFPGETEADVEELAAFLEAARLDVVGVFGYSDEDGTEAAGLDGALADDVVAARVERITDLVEELMSQRAEDRVGDLVEVLVEEFDEDDGRAVGRAAHQGPEVDGVTRLLGGRYAIGTMVSARVVSTEGADLLAEPVTEPVTEPVAGS